MSLFSFQSENEARKILIISFQFSARHFRPPGCESALGDASFSIQCGKISGWLEAQEVLLDQSGHFGLLFPAVIYVIFPLISLKPSNFSLMYLNKLYSNHSSKFLSVVELTTEFRLRIPKHQPLPLRRWKIKEEVVNRQMWRGSDHELFLLLFTERWSRPVEFLFLLFHSHCQEESSERFQPASCRSYRGWEAAEVPTRLALPWALAPSIHSASPRVFV